jgi:hypothetical protein
MEQKKCQRSIDTIKKSKLLDACLNGNGDLFKEVKAMRKTSTIFADSIDGVHDDVPNHFKQIYSKLYNSVEDAADVAIISQKIEDNIKSTDMTYIDKVTTSVVKTAASKVKADKGDPVQSFSSDCIKVNSEILFESLTHMIKSFLVHGYVPQFLLLATLVPIIKDKLGSISVSKNYRSVCISSLILKIIDWVILGLHGSSLDFHDLQFAYQPEVSSTMCSWALIETVDYFLRHGSSVYGCSMDKTKAFDMCRFSILFTKLYNVLCLIFLRIIVFMYVHQFCNVRWNNEISSNFAISNGVGQGKILAGFAFCFYCRDLLDILKNSGYGCTINGDYAGALSLSDDDFLLSPSVSGLQKMINITEDFSTSHGLQFSTDVNPAKSKTKCIAWLQEPRPLARLILSGNELPWVDSLKHLGITISNNMHDFCDKDRGIKNAKYVAKNIEINQEFYFTRSDTKIMINKLYNTSYFGSVVWDLFHPSVKKVESSYNRSAKVMMNLPYATHRGLIEPLSGERHILYTLYRRFLTFSSRLQKSHKSIVQTLYSIVKNDAGSTTGHNL